jgi:hypothetical protein
MSKRGAAMAPVFATRADGRESKSVVGERECPGETTQVYHVLGFGATANQAKAMALASAGAGQLIAFEGSAV